MAALRASGGLKAGTPVACLKEHAWGLRRTSPHSRGWVEIEEIAAGGQDIRGTPIGMLKGLPKPVIGIEQNSMGLSSAREERDAQPGKRLVILSSGQPIGLLTAEVLSGDALPPDPFAAVPKRPAVLGIDDAEAAFDGCAVVSGDVVGRDAKVLGAVEQAQDLGIA